MSPHAIDNDHARLPMRKIYTEISVVDVHSLEAGLSKRATTRQMDMSLKAEESWYWGADKKATTDLNTNPIADLTGIAPDTERYLTMERFSVGIASTECVDGTIKMTFKNCTAFNTAKQNRDWINDEASRSVCLVLAPGICGIVTRQPYHVDYMSFDTNGRYTLISAGKQSWQDALPHGKFQLNTEGIMNDPSPATDVRKRLVPIKRMDSIDVAGDFSGNIFSLPINDTAITAAIDCKQCDTRGKLNLDIDVEFNVLSDNTGTAQITSRGVGADVVLGFIVGGTLTNELSTAISLTPPPKIGLGGIHIPGVIDIGPTIRVLGQASLSEVSAQVEFSVGANLDVPADSIAKIDFNDAANNQLSGWAPTFTPVPPDLSGSVSVSGVVGPSINLELEISIVGGAAGVAAGLSLGAPELTITLDATADAAGGVCGNADAQVGVNVDLELAAELDAFAGFGAATDLPNAVTLFATSTPLFSSCFTIPGSSATATLSPSATTTDAATTTSSAATATGSTTTFSTTNCDPNGDSGSNPLQADTCTPAGLNEAFMSGSLTFPALDVGNGCVVEYFSDSACTTRIGAAFSPSSGKCISASDLGEGADTVQLVMVSGCGL